MSSLVTDFNIIQENGNIFDTEMEYIIPLYQRAYAWGDKQLIQLIEDIKDMRREANNYYIGSLIVSKENGRYEVVDGQQRLTSLYLLLNCLGIKTKPTLTFACREKSNYTLRNIEALLQDNLDMDRIESSIFQGIKILSQELERPGFDKMDFVEKLKKVKIYRIEVPKHTDLNRYFEIMNTRGEQLEQHDILKARLMSYLDNTERGLFAKIWDACSDMTGYVQMHFASTAVRESIFGSEWSAIPKNSWEDYKEVMTAAQQQTKGRCIRDLIKAQNDDAYDDNDNRVCDDNDNRVRFDSVIEFPYFLLHTLIVYIHLYDITHINVGVKIMDKLLDDKKLVDAFESVIKNGVAAGVQIADSKETIAHFARTFILCLLRTRFLFDKYIIKREYANDSTEGEWSLKSLCKQQTQKKAYYKNTEFKESGEWSKTNDRRVKTNIMIQSALRVSYTSPKGMHWITKLLIWLSENDCQHLRNKDITQFHKEAEQIAIDAVKESFFDACADGDYAKGVNTPHIVFNYLDYLLWDSDRRGKKRYGDFVFEFRNSVEHWYPQHPSSFEPWKDGVDQFGNLCIIQRNENSKFSNMSPEAKKSTFKAMIAKGSIKLRIMSELTEKSGDKAWKETVCKTHGDEMLGYLKRACQIE